MQSFPTMLSLLLSLATLSACGGGGSRSTPPPTNTPPTANAGADQSVTENATVQLAGQGTDPEGSTVTYSWSQISGPIVSLSSSTDPNATLEAPEVSVGNVDDVVLALTVSDAQGASTTDQVTLSVASADYVVFRADIELPGTSELYKYDPQTDTISKLSGTLISDGNVQRFIVSPNGDFVAYIAEQDTNDVFELYVAAVDGSGAVKVNGELVNEGTVKTSSQSVQWAPDSSALAYLADETTNNITELYTVAPDGSENIKVNLQLVRSGAGNGGVFNYAWSPDSTQIAYVADGDTNDVKEVYLVDRDGANGRKINNNVGSPPNKFLDDIRWSPDGRYVSARVFDLDEPKVSIGINTMDILTTPATNARINLDIPLNGGVFEYAWSPDSSRIAYLADLFVNNDFEDLYSVRPDGNDHVQLNPRLVQSQPLVQSGNVVRFEWSPNGSFIAYRASQDTNDVNELYTVSPDGSENTKVNGALIPDGAVDNTFVWSPDSAHIAYRADQDTNNVTEIYVSSPDGISNVKVSGLLVDDGRADMADDEIGNQVWAPDSAHLIVKANQFDKDIDELFVVDTEGLSNTQITRTPVAGGELASYGQWSADGSAIVYASMQDDDSVIELYIATPDGLSNMKISGQLMPGGDGDVFDDFTWSP